jgi:hypothetical protein
MRRCAIQPRAVMSLPPLVVNGAEAYVFPIETPSSLINRYRRSICGGCRMVSTSLSSGSEDLSR